MVVAKLVALQLSSNLILDPLLAERLLLALGPLGVHVETRPKMFQRAIGVICEMILTESSRSGPAYQMETSAQMENTIVSLPPTEFPNLTEFRERPRRRGRTGGSSKARPLRSPRNMRTGSSERSVLVDASRRPKFGRRAAARSATSFSLDRIAVISAKWHCQGKSV
jgi:hypothetical protein